MISSSIKKLKKRVVPLGTHGFCFGTCEEDGGYIPHFGHKIAIPIQRSFESEMGFPAAYACYESIFQ